jgi:nickel-dependent lactate racemase
MEATASKAARAYIGKGSADSDLSPAELREILEESLMQVAPGARVLGIIPDKTRDDNTDVLFPFAAEILSARRVEQFDALVAQGTHVPMSEDEKRSKVGFGHGSSLHGLGQIFDHQWNVPEQLTTIGELSAIEVSRLTGGLISDAVKVNLNRLLAPGTYDTILIFSATVPHEVAGFAGGAKYFFPRRCRSRPDPRDTLAGRSGQHRKRDWPRRDADSSHDRGSLLISFPRRSSH